MTRDPMPPRTAIATYSGIAFDLAAPTADMVCVEDVAHHLSLINRYTGATEVAYSVAQHACLVHDLLVGLGEPPETCFGGLHHDSAEAYVGDVSSPLKRMLGDIYRRYEFLAQYTVEAAFGIALTDAARQAIRDADRALYAWERRDVAPIPGGAWDATTFSSAFEIILPWPARQAEAEFAERHQRYRR